MHGTGPCLVVAGPGSGKTSVIIQHIYKLLSFDKISPKNILIITFTRAAAAEMRSRFRRAYPNLGEELNFGTFHAIFWHILCSSDSGHSYQLITEKEQLNIIRRILMQNNWTAFSARSDVEDIMRNIGRLKNSADAGSVSAYERDTTLEAVRESELRKLRELYDKELRKKELIDYDDMILICYQRFLADERLLATYRQKYQYILVDEFQDSNEYQYRTLRLLVGDRCNLFAVGDDDQSIYGFRGANPGIMRRLLEDYSDTHLVRLLENYRCGCAIIKCTNRLIEHNTGRIDKRVLPGKNHSGKVEVIRTAKWCLPVLSEPYVGSTAILLRTNRDAALVTQQLIRNRITCFVHNRISRFYEHFIIQDLLSYARICEEPFDLTDFLRIMNRPNRNLTRYYLNADIGQVTIGDLMLLFGEDAEAMHEIRKLEHTILQARDMDLYLRIRFLYRKTEYDKYLRREAIRSGEDIAEYEELLDIFFETIREMKSIADWEKYMELVEGAQDMGNEKDSYVQVMTYHMAKGLEFDRVILPNLVDGVVPHKKTADVEEERRLFYVAMTRARQELYLIYDEDGDRKQKSRFLAEMGFSDT